MSGSVGAAPPAAVLGLGLEIRGMWRRRSRALAHTYLLSRSVHLPPTAGGGSRGPRARVRLPSLSSAKGRRSEARLSEPSLIPNKNVLYERFSRNGSSSVSPKRPPPPASLSRPPALLPFNTCHQSAAERQAQNCSSGYVHFSRQMQLSSKSRPVRHQSQSHTRDAGAGDLRPLGMQDQISSPHEAPLSVTGKPCRPSRSERTTVAAAAAAVGPARPHVHVFLPTEAERDEVDGESVDEGFMDELDSKMTCLLLQQGSPAVYSMLK